MFAHKLSFMFKRVRKVKPFGTDVVAAQVRKILTDTDQKLILMVRG